MQGPDQRGAGSAYNVVRKFGIIMTTAPGDLSGAAGPMQSGAAVGPLFHTHFHDTVQFGFGVDVVVHTGGDFHQRVYKRAAQLQIAATGDSDNRQRTLPGLGGTLRRHDKDRAKKRTRHANTPAQP